MKKRMFALFLAVLMAVSLAACGNSDKMAQLEAENAQLKAQVEELTRQLANAENGGLSDWSFDACAWTGDVGATVTFTGIPTAYADGQKAEITVWLEGDLVEQVACTWDGTAYTAVMDLKAADGYCYYCTITEAGGSQTEVELNTPKNPTDEVLIDMESSLTAYCGMMVEDSTLEGSTLTLTAGYAQIRLPRIGRDGENVTCASVELILESEGSEIGRATVTALEADGENGCSAEIAGVTFSVPALEDDQMLEIRMEATLSDGQILTTTGGNWFYTGGDLLLVVG